MAYKDPEAQRAAWRKWYEANRDKELERSRRKHFIRKYGLSTEDLALMLAEREGRCDICGGVMSAPHVDHCHTSGEIRGLLCSNCNTGLGLFKDSPERLQAAIAYLG